MPTHPIQEPREQLPAPTSPGSGALTAAQLRG
uniref:Uncharacterized protein n=1 Tax=Arundo donax TaxID=35708 RepID=A0A0A9FG52_ARUDO